MSPCTTQGEQHKTINTIAARSATINTLFNSHLIVCLVTLGFKKHSKLFNLNNKASNTTSATADSVIYTFCM